MPLEAPEPVPQRVRALAAQGYAVVCRFDSWERSAQVRISRDPIHWFFQLGIAEMEAWLEGQYVVGVWENILHPSEENSASLLEEAKSFGIRQWDPSQEQMNRAGNLIGAETARLFMDVMGQPGVARQVLPAVEVRSYSTEGDTVNLDLDVTLPQPVKYVTMNFTIEEEKPKDIAPPPRRLIDIGSNEQE